MKLVTENEDITIRALAQRVGISKREIKILFYKIIEHRLRNQLCPPLKRPLPKGTNEKRKTQHTYLNRIKQLVDLTIQLIN